MGKRDNIRTENLVKYYPITNEGEYEAMQIRFMNATQFCEGHWFDSKYIWYVKNWDAMSASLIHYEVENDIFGGLK